jgi:hypothetical protein
MQAPEDTTLDYSRVPHILGVPRFFYRQAVQELVRAVACAWKNDRVASFDAELFLWFFAGVIHQRWRDRALPRPPRAAASDQLAKV